MRTLCQRLLRLWHEPRIRLPAPGLRAGNLGPGDRLQISSRLWRVAARQDGDQALTFELTLAEGPPRRARLRLTSGRWTFAFEDGGKSPASELDPAAVIHYPVSAVAAR